MIGVDSAACLKDEIIFLVRYIRIPNNIFLLIFNNNFTT